MQTNVIIRSGEEPHVFAKMTRKEAREVIDQLVGQLADSNSEKVGLVLFDESGSIKTEVD